MPTLEMMRAQTAATNEPGHPPHAERLDFFAYNKTERVPSRFAAKAEALRSKFVCPSCESELPIPAPYTKTECGHCGLMMRREPVGDLYIWRDEKVPA